jgi:hypothetical protein
MDNSQPIINPSPVVPGTPSSQQKSPIIMAAFAVVAILVLVGAVIASSLQKNTTPGSGEMNGELTPSDEMTQEILPDVTIQPGPEVTQVEVVSPAANEVVTSPVMVDGIVPPGWMFEGQLTLRLLDDQQQLIVEAPGLEKYPGSWQTGESIEFSGSLEFTTSAATGTLVVAKANPSGLPENEDSFSVPVRFQ